MFFVSLCGIASGAKLCFALFCLFLFLVLLSDLLFLIFRKWQGTFSFARIFSRTVKFPNETFYWFLCDVLLSYLTVVEFKERRVLQSGTSFLPRA